MADLSDEDAEASLMPAPFCFQRDPLAAPADIVKTPVPEGWIGPDFLGQYHTFSIPANIIARVDATPRLPKMTAQWYWVDHSPNLVIDRVNHIAQISYSERGRSDVSSSLNYFSASLLASYDFLGDVLGGTLTAKCIVHWRDPATGRTGLSSVGTQLFGILGDNPSKATVRTALGSLDLQVIAYKESRLKQFDNAGLPLWGPPNGFGVMQLDNPRPTGRQLWDWKQNTSGAASLLATKKVEVGRHFDNIYTKYKKAPKLTADQIRLSVYQYYNGGWYWDWDDTNSIWVTSGPTAYGDDAVRIERLVLAGTPPGDWN